ncbi:MAG: alpha/beta hydrolase, partial [Treponema sp.]|nr:alpha/beta hydrolase [Treponema sp.]
MENVSADSDYGRAAYQQALASLAAVARRVGVNGVDNGVDIEVRDCADRTAGKLDPRTALVLSLTRDDFERNFKRYDRELWPNGIHILGPRNTEGRTNLEIYRASFGWKSGDLSRGVNRSCFCVPSKWGPVPVYAYVPEETAALPRPCLVFYHGGAFVAGDTETVENQCKLIAERAGAVVLSVDYPLAPESPFPVGFDCCYAVLEYALGGAEAL